MKDNLPEDKGYWTRACPEARVFTGHHNLRCSNCPWVDKDCILANLRLKKEILLAHIANLLKAFGYTEEINVATVIKILGDND